MVTKFMPNRAGYDPEHWTTEDGHRHVSIPTDVPPTAWVQVTTNRNAANTGWAPVVEPDSGRACGIRLEYVSGDYRIHREPHGVRRWTFRLFRGTTPLGIGSFSRLVDAKAHALRNAAGHEVVNVA